MVLVNLLPWRKRRLRRRARNWLMLLLLQLALIALTLGGCYRVWQQQRLMLQHQLSDMSAQQRQLTAQYRQTRQTWNRLRDYQAQRDADAAGTRHNQRYLKLLEQMASMMPRRLWLTDVVDRGERLVISGLSESYGDIVDLNRSLGRHPALGRVRVLQASRQQSERSLLRFSLQADWAPVDLWRDGRSDD
ncbi:MULTISPECIES: PilN domain-containing protein [Brenneria]|uniref:Fimbrial protein n=1 Tax=Brenneria nigrifluens DSM 30175 = ATCC 13028 TaxID=1121120 RepID=A0A2U1UTB9_9GAMM|nr:MULTISPECIES: PilN domain-containing protein [Brenneria]EHD19838.1 Fimbrial assembly family protein [Brenneria sp. EniD312]PWC24913.1 fimbrial protein [Brenneria nigrifluens] [Brenneria nigrifluens DSM 30175 = ATCC 13028]QCR03092.1 fimbrial protein [Brenneria nigrifluens] [Brenneria nigrifluens DSM 30175 = ATCC 13028]